MIDNREKIYVEKINPRDKATIENITKPRNWDYQLFKEVNTALSIVPEGNFVPASNRPETIHLQGFSEDISKLQQLSKNDGNEYACPIFSDIDKKTFVRGKITVGNKTEVIIDSTPQPGREKYQKCVATIHVHPLDSNSYIAAHGFSGTDFKTFLSSRTQKFMIMTWGENKLLALKTSVTPNHLSRLAIDTRIKDISEDFLSKSTPSTVFKKVVDFNKEVCTEFGLTLYNADKQNRDLFSRVNVAT